MTTPRIDWDRLVGKHPAGVVQAAKQLFEADEPFSITPGDLASHANGNAEAAEKLLTEMCPPLEKVSEFYCPHCDGELDSDQANSEICPHCQKSYEDDEVRKIAVFVYRSSRTRDVIWALALHGMNTRGAWQEEFNWRMSNTYGRAVPVAIYKYGLVRPGAIWSPSLNRKVCALVTKINTLKGETAREGFDGPPDVIAHSLGTWLIGHALQRNSALKIGRLILTGSILRPDFDWASLVARGQVQAVLNHYGDKDFWASIAHFAIPDSGPSGRRGFDAKSGIAQVRAAGFRHSDFFLPKNLGVMFKMVWIPFLTRPTGTDIDASVQSAAWTPAPWPFRATILPLILLALFWGILGILLCACLRGALDGVLWMLR
jgi:hypothetical protein